MKLPRPQTLEIPLALKGGSDSPLRVRIRSYRRARNFKMWIGANSLVEVTKPAAASVRDALEFVEKNADWLSGALSRAKKSTTLADWFARNPELFDGATLLRATVVPSKSGNFTIENPARKTVMFCTENSEMLPKLFTEYARKKIERAVVEKALATSIDAHVRVSVRNQTRRWGSCSTSGALCFNWRILLLDAELQNYVICHELAHTKFMDHSVSFWMFLNSICPNARKLDALLSAKGDAAFGVER